MVTPRMNVRSSRARGGGGARLRSPIVVVERIKIGKLMLPLHGRLNTDDPLYAVGSFYEHGEPYPDIHVVERARGSIALRLADPKRREGISERDLRTILAYLERELAPGSHESADVDVMLHAYATAALSSGVADDGSKLNLRHDVDGFAKGAYAWMRQDVTSFARDHAADVGDRWSQAGRDLWTSRNRRSPSFADHASLYGKEAAARLNAAARKLGKVTVFEVKKKVHAAVDDR